MTVYAITTQTYTEDQLITLGGVQYTVLADNIYANSAYDELLGKISTNDTLLITGIEGNTSIIQAFGQKNISVFVDSTLSNIQLNNISFISLTIYQGLDRFTGNSFNVQTFVSPTVTFITLNKSSLFDFSNFSSLSNIVLNNNQYPDNELIIPDNCLNIKIENCTYLNVLIPKNLTSLYIQDLSNEISIESTESLHAYNSNVSCPVISKTGGDTASAISVNNYGIIGDIEFNNVTSVNIMVVECNSIIINNCNVIFDPNIDSYFGSIFTHAKSKLSITNSTINRFVIDFGNPTIENITLSGLSWSNFTDHTLYLKNFDSENIEGLPMTQCSDVFIWNCPNFIIDESYTNNLSIINSNTSVLPQCNLKLIACSDLTYLEGTFPQLYVYCCPNIKWIDLTNVSQWVIVGNTKLESVIYNRTEVYGAGTNPLFTIDELVKKFSTDEYHLFRFNAFKNVDFISNPNFIDNKLYYGKEGYEKYILEFHTPEELFASVTNPDPTQNIIYTGMYSLYLDAPEGSSFTLFMFADLIFMNNFELPISDSSAIPIAFLNLSEESIFSNSQIINNNRFTFPRILFSDSDTIDTLLANDQYNNIISLKIAPGNKPSDISNIFNINLVI